MTEVDDFVWLLKILGGASKMFSTLYGVDFKIPHIIWIKNGEPKIWFYMEKNEIKFREDELLKYKIIKEYFATGVDMNKLYERVSNENFYPVATYNETNENETIFYALTYSDQTKVLKKVTRKVAEEIFKNPLEHNDIFNGWQKIISCFEPNLLKNLSFYEVYYIREKEKSRIEVIRKNIEFMYLEYPDVKVDNNKKNITEKQKFNSYKSRSFQINQNCEHLINSIVRFLEGKLKKKVFSLKIDLFIDAKQEFWLDGAENLQFYNGNDIESADKNELPQIQKIQNPEYKCTGIYCKKDMLYDENDEDNNLYIMSMNYSTKGAHRIINYKSILLDIIERNKTIERIKEACPNISEDKINEKLVTKFRRFYDIGDLANDDMFRRMRISNYYFKCKVCNYCFAVYNKLDVLRNQQKSPQNATLEQISQEIEGSNLNFKMNVKSKYSKNFYQKLENFGITEKKFIKNYRTSTSSVDNFYMQKTKQLNNRFSDSVSSELSKPKKFILPSVYERSVYDKKNNITTNKKFILKKNEETLGLKHFLGHTDNLPYSDCGLAISKSSYMLNKLSDKLNDIDKIRSKAEQKVIDNIRNEIELVLCPYYGKGKIDPTNLKAYVEELKSKNEENNEFTEENDECLIQVATDKNEFLTEKQKKLKFDKEEKQKQVIENNKKFLETYSHLSDSILGLSVKKSKVNVSEDEKI